MPRPSLVAPTRTLALLASLAACKPSPAKIELAQALPPLLLSTDPIALSFKVLDDALKPIEPAPALRLDVKPTTVAILQGSLLVPVMNGEATLTVVASNDVALSLPLKVRIADRAALSCGRDPCNFALQDELRFEAKFYSSDELVPVPAPTWTVTPPGVLDDRGQGRFVARAPGDATVSVRVGAAEAKRTITVSAAVEQLALKCPDAFLTEYPGHGTLCALRPGKRLTVDVVATGGGRPVPAPTLEWSTKDDGVATVTRGTVEVVGPGSTEIVARSGAISGALVVDVFPDCAGAWVPHVFDPGAGAKVPLSCQNPAPRPCLDRGLEVFKELNAELLGLCCCKHGRAR